MTGFIVTLIILAVIGGGAYYFWSQNNRGSSAVSTQSQPALRSQPLVAASTTVSSARLERDRVTANEKLPSNTRESTLDGTTYWTYSVTCKLGRRYTMTLYFDGHEYQVRVLSPKIPSDVGLKDSDINIHKCHYFPNGRLCLDPPGNGAKSLEEAFAKSVVWATGFSIYVATGQFAFSR